MAGQLNLTGSGGGATQLVANDTATTDQKFVFPDTGGTVVTDDFTGDVEIDGKITAAGGNFEVNANGRATTSSDAGGFHVYDIDASNVAYTIFDSGSGTNSFIVKGDGTMRADRELTVGTWANNNIPAVQVGKASATTTGIVKIKGDGSNNSALSIRANGNSSSAEVGSIKANGDAAFRNTRSANVLLEVGRDNPANYVSTTNADGETESVYNGKVLDVKESIRTMQVALVQLKAAVLVPHATVDDLRLRILEALETITEEVD